MLLQNKSAIYDYSFHKMLSNLKVQVQERRMVFTRYKTCNYTNSITVKKKKKTIILIFSK